MVRRSYRPLRARTRRCGTPIVLGRAMDVEDLESCSPPCCRLRPRFPAGSPLPATGGELRRGRIGPREWARRNGRLGDIHSIDYRYDHDIDELMT
jgi:hypothetical protein